MRSRQILFAQIKQKQSVLCVGLDPDVSLFPKDFFPHTSVTKRVLSFHQAIIDATESLSVAYKLNLAFYEALGAQGYRVLHDTLAYLQKHAPHCLLIADAKRIDVGHTSEKYATAYLKNLPFHAITLAPYLGRESIEPFLKMNAWVILLAATSNIGFKEFHELKLQNGEEVWAYMLQRMRTWGTEEQIMFVVGATRGVRFFQKVREIVPDHFLLVPGIGAQGASTEDVLKYGLNTQGGLLINSSRGLLYTDSNASTFQKTTYLEAQKIQRITAYALKEVHL